MANMSYCRFSNTLNDLRECYDAMGDDEPVSPEEGKARNRLIEQITTRTSSQLHLHRLHLQRNAGLLGCCPRWRSYESHRTTTAAEREGLRGVLCPLRIVLRLAVVRALRRRRL